MPELPPLIALADFLHQQRDSITAEWMKRVRQDRKIPSADDLPREELLDHLPTILDSLLEGLRHAATERKKTSEKSQTHGKLRWRQNYRLDEVLREITTLRHVLMEYLLAFQRESNLLPDLQPLAFSTVNDALDAVVRNSTTGFVEKQQAEIHASNRSLEALNTQIQSFNDHLVKLDEKRLLTLRAISHEIANHLNAMSLVASLACKTSDPDAIASHTHRISQGVSAMTALMKQLMEFATLASAGETLRLEPCDPTSLFAELSTTVRQLCEQKGLGFKPQLDPTLKEITTDPDKLRRICFNLANNAVKFTAAGEVRFSFRSRQDYRWQLEISDTGCGISPEDQERIFDEFYRVGTEPGIGLGLAIVRHLARLLGGEIEVSSRPGDGASFRVLFPN